MRAISSLCFLSLLLISALSLPNPDILASNTISPTSFTTHEGEAVSPKPGSIFDFTLQRFDGQSFPLSRFKGKALLIVNAADYCHFTGQYVELQTLWQKYAARGLVIIAIPINSASLSNTPIITPADDPQLQQLCSKNNALNFWILQKHHANGQHSHPIFEWLSQQTQQDQRHIFSQPLHKFLLNPDGQVAGWFSPFIKPASATLVEAIEANLPPSYSLSARQ
jgi:glutathione peroxidase